MAKQKKHIDDLFKDLLNDSELPLTGNEWDAIANELHPKKKRFGWWIWLLPALLLSAGVWYVVASKSDSTTENNDAETELVAETNFDELNEISTEERTSQEELSAEEAISETSNTISETVSEPSNPIAEQVSASSSEEVEVVDASPVIEQPANNSTPSSEDEVPADETPLTKPMEPKPTPSIADLTIRKEYTLAEIHSFSIKSIGLDEIPYVLDRNAIKASKEPDTKVNAGTLPQPPRFTNPTIGFNINPMINSQSIAGAAEHQDYENYRAQNETSRVLMSYDLMYKMNMKSLNLGTGISFLQKGQSTQALTYQLFDSIPHIIGQDTVDYFYFNYRDTTLNSQFSSPTYSYISVPVLLGKTFYISTRFNVETNLQSNIGVLVGAKGDVLSTGIKPTSLNDLPLNKLLIDAGGSIRLNYRMNQQFTLQLNTSISQDLTNTLSSTVIKQKFTRYGFGVGVYYHLNK